MLLSICWRHRLSLNTAAARAAVVTAGRGALPRIILLRSCAGCPNQNGRKLYDDHGTCDGDNVLCRHARRGVGVGEKTRYNFPRPKFGRIE